MDGLHSGAAVCTYTSAVTPHVWFRIPQVCIFRKHYPRAERAFMKKCLSPDVGDSLRKVPDDKRHRRMSAAVAAAKAKDPMVWCRLCEVKWHKNATPKVNPPPAKEKDAGCSGKDAQWVVRGSPEPATPDDAASSPPSPPLRRRAAAPGCQHAGCNPHRREQAWWRAGPGVRALW